MKKLLFITCIMASLGFTSMPAGYQPPVKQQDRPNRHSVISRTNYLEVTSNDYTIVNY